MKTALLWNKATITAFLIGLFVLSGRFETSGATRHSRAFAVFINESGARIQVNVISEDKNDKITLPLPPQGIEGALFTTGQVELRTPSEDMVSGRVLFTRSLPTPEAASEFYERSTRSFYFRIVGEKILLVKPSDLTSKERRWLKARTKHGW